MTSPVTVRVVPATAERWDELAAFFGLAGAYSHCWCTWFRQPASAFSAGCRDEGAGNRELLHRLALGGQVPGLIAYQGDAPVGWVSVGPREQFGRILRSRFLRPEPGDPTDDIWSVVCFWVPRHHRRQGLARVLLNGAVRHALAAGARVVEGYPVDTTERHPAADGLFTGTLGMFIDAQFEVVRRRSPARPVVQFVSAGAGHAG